MIETDVAHTPQASTLTASSPASGCLHGTEIFRSLPLASVKAQAVYDAGMFGMIAVRVPYARLRWRLRRIAGEDSCDGAFIRCASHPYVIWIICPSGNPRITVIHPETLTEVIMGPKELRYLRPSVPCSSEWVSSGHLPLTGGNIIERQYSQLQFALRALFCTHQGKIMDEGLTYSLLREVQGF